MSKRNPANILQDFFCDPGETRTLGPLIKSQLLYQLSYGVGVCNLNNLNR